MHIHFVCTGNAYRSRLAECLLNSKQLVGLTVSSSGTQAGKHYEANGPISWMAMRLIQRHCLIPFMKLVPETTTQQMLAQADLVIFLHQEHYEYVQEHLGYSQANYQIWRILDIDDLPDAQAIMRDEGRLLKVTEQTFTALQQKVDALVKELQESYPPLPQNASHERSASEESGLLGERKGLL